ncbi:MAG TPA: E2 ligase fold family C protein, partial [Gemmatimonadaceae bacterium]
MALADFFDRTAVAASHILLGYDDAAFRQLVGETAIGLALGPDLSENEGRHSADMAMRLTARLYPTIVLHVAPGAEPLAESLEALARSINPKIDVLRDGATAKSIVLGQSAPPATNAKSVVYVGSNGWDALISLSGPLGFGKSSNPFGAGAAAAIACADVFATVFGAMSPCGRGGLTFSTLEGIPSATSRQLDPGSVEFAGTVMAGQGAIANAAIWSLARSGARGEMHLVDDEALD